ncbi:UNVERIFIED_CONTAM: hypothetical protein NCL1_31670 [Trichonephila clavipes]
MICVYRSWPNIGDMHLIGADTLHLHQEIESLKRQLLEREYHILKMETSVLNHAEQYPNGEWEHLQQELLICKDKYESNFLALNSFCALLVFISCILLMGLCGLFCFLHCLKKAKHFRA